ncbi:MAG: hypothetical protein LBI84_02830 [Propionibacteriaceae bacterium]|nr:hypothetical protein [Propionibacteriaceae bacterium]
MLISPLQRERHLARQANQTTLAAAWPNNHLSGNQGQPHRKMTAGDGGSLEENIAAGNWWAILGSNQ